MTRLNPRLAKINRPYTEREVADLFGVHRNTVRGWRQRGLPAIDDRRPAMFNGRALRGFLEAQHARAKRPCPPGTIYCCKCRAPRPPAPASVFFEVGDIQTGNVRALCATCGTRMFQRARQSTLEAKFPGLAIQVVKAPPHIAECPPPSPNCA